MIRYTLRYAVRYLFGRAFFYVVGLGALTRILQAMSFAAAFPADQQFVVAVRFFLGLGGS